MPGIDPISTGLVIAAATAAVSGAGAIEQNRQANKREDAAKKAADVQTKQLRDQAQLEASKRSREARLIRGAILARDSVAGDALLNQVDADLGLNLDILGKNLNNSLGRVTSGLDADLASIQTVNPLLSSFTGGLQGFGAGVGIGSAFQNYQTRQPQVVIGDPLSINGVFA